MNISVDVGYGYTKAVSDTGARVSFPSATAPGAVNPIEGAGGMFERKTDYSVRITDLNGSVERRVGQSALQSAACRTFIAREEKPADMHDVLLLTAAYLVSDSAEPSLAVGLPLSYYKAQKDALKERLESINAWVSVNGNREKYMRFKSVKVFPQGTGALVAYGSVPERGLIGLIDIGTYTTDYLLFEMQDGVPAPIVDACGAYETGIFLAHEAVALEYKKATGATLPLKSYQKVFDSVINGEPVLHWGREINLTPAWLKMRRQIAETIVSGAVAAWKEQINQIALTVFAGGGSLVFFDVLKSMFPHPVLVEEGYFANAVGFLKMISGA